jgi:hypothetical protein
MQFGTKAIGLCAFGWAGLVAMGCGGSTDKEVGSADSNEGGSSSGGTIDARFALPSGSASIASYTLTGPNGFNRTSSIDFDGSQAVEFLIDSVPAGDGYVLSVMASNDGGESCMGSKTLSVATGQEVSVDVTATCTGAPYVPSGYGSLEVFATPPAGVSLASAQCVVTGPAGSEANLPVAVNGTEGIHFVLMVIPAGASQELSLTAQTSTGKTCSAASPFDIVANQVSEAHVYFQCP